MSYCQQDSGSTTLACPDKKPASDEQAVACSSHDDREQANNYLTPLCPRSAANRKPGNANSNGAGDSGAAAARNTATGSAGAGPGQGDAEGAGALPAASRQLQDMQAAVQEAQEAARVMAAKIEAQAAELQRQQQEREQEQWRAQQVGTAACLGDAERSGRGCWPAEWRPGRPWTGRHCCSTSMGQAAGPQRGNSRVFGPVVRTA